MPQVSVVIPTYNCDRYLPEAIESVLSQTYNDYEVIVIDDGSTDRTQEVLQPYQSQVRSIQQHNQGASAARNHGITLARGRWVAFLDADDVLFPDKLAAQIAIAAARPSLGIVHSGWQRVNEKRELLLTVEPWQQIPTLDLESWLRYKPVLPSAMLFRRDWLEKVGGFDPQFSSAEDTDLVLRLVLHGCESAWLEQVTVQYRQHETNTMHKGLSQAQSLAAVIDRFFAQPQVPAEIRLIETQVRYSTDVWIAWYLNHTEHYSEMVQYLQRAWQHSPYLPIETYVHWIDSFAEFSQSWGVEFDAEALATLPEWQDLMQWVRAAL